MELLLSLVMVFVLVAGTVLFHYEGLRFLSIGPWSMRMNPRMEMQVIILGVCVLHVVEVVIYGGAYWVGAGFLDLGSFGHNMTFQDYIYFSVETYTSLGYGDVVSSGDLRIVAGFECLNGLLLLGWSASFTFLQMQLYWVRHKSERTTHGNEPEEAEVEFIEPGEAAEVLTEPSADVEYIGPRPRRRRNRARRAAARVKTQAEP